MLLGHWRNFEDLEESLTLEEVIVLLDSFREQRHDEKRFMAGLQGHDIGPYGAGATKDRFEDVKRRAALRAGGVDPDKLELGSIGIAFENEE